jgi:tRNA(Ile)-lysidine synthase
MIEEKVLRTIQEHSMLEKGDAVIVAFSGGVDSTALLYMLNSLKSRLKIKLYAMHLNHMIRGKDAALDAAFARKISKKLKVPFIAEEFDVPSFAKQKKLNLEDAARRVRYEFLERAAAKVGANKIAVAHNADDNIETLLMRMIRGTGMKGMEGIPPVRDKIIRPLIGTYRADIEKYLRSKKITPRIDRSNFETKYLRNKIRQNLIPALEKNKKDIKELLLQIIASANRIHDFIEALAKKALETMIVSKSSNEISLDAGKFLNADPALKGEIMRLAIELVRKDLSDISFSHIQSIIDLAGKKRAEIDLPRAYVLINKGNISVYSTKPAKFTAKDFSAVLQIPGTVKNSDLGFVIESDVMPSISISELKMKDPNRAYLDYDKISGPLTVRSRRAGDHFSPLGLKGSKKLQDIFVDEKVDLDKRDSIPVVDDGKKIVWVVGYRMSEDAKVTDSTKKVVRLSAKKI